MLWLWQRNVGKAVIGELVDGNYVKLSKDYVTRTATTWDMLKKKAKNVFLGCLPEDQRKAELTKILRGTQGQLDEDTWGTIWDLLERAWEILEETGSQVIGAGGVVLGTAKAAPGLANI